MPTNKRSSIGFHINIKKAADGSGYFMEGKFGDNQSHTSTIAVDKDEVETEGVAAFRRALEDLE